MATYRNDTTSTFHVPNISGVLTKVAPTESIETYMVLGTGWTKTADTPYKVTARDIMASLVGKGVEAFGGIGLAEGGDEVKEAPSPDLFLQM